jgi:hypothetical protein
MAADGATLWPGTRALAREVYGAERYNEARSAGLTRRAELERCASCAWPNLTFLAVHMNALCEALLSEQAVAGPNKKKKTRQTAKQKG